MPVVFEYSGLDAAVLVALRVAALATFSLTAAVLVGVAAWLLCCGLEATRSPRGSVPGFPDCGSGT